MKKRLVSLLLVLIMVLTVLPIQAPAADDPMEALLRQELYRMVDANEYPDGLISFLTPRMECAEGQEFVEFAVVRYGPTDGNAAVEFKAIDISAKYGEDYYITVQKTFRDDKLAMDEDAQPVIEVMAESADRSVLTLGTENTDRGDPSETEEIPESEDAPAIEEERLTYEGGAAELPDASKGIVDALAAARTALLGVKTDMTSWKDSDRDQKAIAEAVLAENLSYYDKMPGASYTLHFASGEYMKVLRFYIIDDHISESDEQVLFALLNAEGAALDPNPTGYMNITDNDGVEPSVYTFDETRIYAAEGESYVTVTLTRTGGLEQYDIVTLGTSALTAVPGVDYPALEQEVTFVPGQSRQTIRIPVLSGKRGESRSFNLQTRYKADSAAVTVVLPVNESGTELTANDGTESPALPDGNAFIPNAAFKSLAGSGTFKYRVYELLNQEVKVEVSDLTHFINFVPASMGGIAKVDYSILNYSSGTYWETTIFGLVIRNGWHTGTVDKLSINGGSNIYSSNDVNTPEKTDTFTLSKSDRSKSYFRMETTPKGNNNYSDLRLEYMDVYVSPLEIYLRTPAEEDPDGTVRGYTWDNENAYNTSGYVSYKMGRLSFAGEDVNLYSKAVYPDGSGSVSFEAVYNSDITQTVLEKTYLWGYKIERKAGQADGVQWYYVQGTEFNATDFFNDKMKDSVTGATILHNSCVDTQTDVDVDYYSIVIQPVFKVKEALVQMAWNTSKLEGYQGTFTSGKTMNVGMLDTINFHLVSKPGSDELPTAYKAYGVDKAVADPTQGDVMYTASVQVSLIRFEPLNVSGTLTLTGKSGNTATLPFSFSLDRSSYTQILNFDFPTDILGTDDLESATISIDETPGYVAFQATIERKLLGEKLQSIKTKMAFANNSSGTSYGKAEDGPAIKALDDIQLNAAEPGKLSFSPEAPYTVISVLTDTAGIDVRYDPAADGAGKEVGSIFHSHGDGTASLVDPDEGLYIDHAKIGQPHDFFGIYADEGEGGANVLKDRWAIIWKDWTGDLNRDGVISDEEDALLGWYSTQLNRIAVMGNAYQFLPILPNSQLYYSYVKRDPAPTGQTYQIFGRVYLQSGTVYGNGDYAGGHLVDDPQPIEGAMVTVDGQTVYTDADGNFTFDSAYFRNNENYLAIISYQGITYITVLQVNAFKRVVLQEYRYFTPYDLKAYLNGSAMDLSNAMYPHNGDATQRWTFSIAENMPNVTAEEVHLNIYSKEGSLIVSLPAKYERDKRLWALEFNPANCTGVTEGQAQVIPPAATMTLTIKDNNGVTYPEFEVGVSFVKKIDALTFLNSFQTPLSGTIDYIGKVDAFFDLGLTAKADDLLDSVTSSSSEGILISFGISKDFSGNFGGGENGLRAGSNDIIANATDVNAVDYLKNLAAKITGGGSGSDIDEAHQAVQEAVSGDEKKAGELIEGYNLEIGAAFYLSLKLDAEKGQFYFDGLVMGATFLGDVGVKYSISTPIGVTLFAHLQAGGAITALMVLEPYNYAKVYFDGEDKLDLSKAGISDRNRELNIYGEFLIQPYVQISAGASLLNDTLVNGSISGKAQFDMAFSTSGSGMGSVEVTCRLTLDAIGGLVHKTWVLADHTWDLFSYSNALALDGDSDYRYDSVSLSETMDRDYLNRRGGWKGSSPLTNSPGWGNEHTLESGVYPYAYPLITDIGEETQLMVFLDTDGTHEHVQNSTRLYYTVYENGAWSAPQTVDDDDNNDDTPTMYDLGDKVLVLWTSAVDAITADTHPIDAMNNRDIKARFFNKATHEWSPISDVTMTTEQDTTGDSVGTVVYCVDGTGKPHLMVTYSKNAYVSSGNGSEDVLVGDILEPVSTLAYRFYDFENEKWVDTYDAATKNALMSTLRSASAVESFEENWYGQNFVDLSHFVSAANGVNSIGDDPTVVENEGIGFVDSNGHAIGLSAYIVDTDGIGSTVEDREIFLQFYDFTAGINYTPIRLTDDNVEQSYISPAFTMDGAEMFFISNGDIVELNVSGLWESLVDMDEETKALNGAPNIRTAVPALSEELPITEFVVDTDGDNDYIFWTERSINYVDGVEPGSPAASLPENILAERHIYASVRSAADGVESVLHDENGDVLTDAAGKPITVLGRAWGGAVRITDEKGANYSDIDVAPLGDGMIRIVYLKGLSTLSTVNGQTIVEENIQNRSLNTADFDLEYKLYDVAIDPIDALPEGDNTAAVTAQVTNNGFLSDRENLYVRLLVSVDGGEARVVDTVKVENLISGRSRNVTFNWEIPENLENVELTVQAVSISDGNTYVYDTDTLTYERSANVSITVLSSVLTDRNVAELTVRLNNYGDAAAVNDTVTASVGNGYSQSQKFTLLPGGETTLTFRVSVPEDSFTAQELEDGSVLDIADITLSAGSTPAITTVSRTASAEEMALMNAIESIALTDTDGNELDGSITVDLNEPVTLGLAAEMTEGWNASELTVILVNEDGNIICDGNTFTATDMAGGTVTAYIIPRGSAVLLTASGTSIELDILGTLANAAIKTLKLNVNVRNSGIIAEGVTLSDTELSLTEGETATLTAAVFPEDAGEVTWSVSPDGIVEISIDGNTVTVTAKKAGTAIITAGINGHTACCTVTVSKPGGDPGTDPSPSDPSQTGDDTNLTLWFVLMGLSGLGLLALIPFSKRRRRKTQTTEN